MDTGRWKTAVLRPARSVAARFIHGSVAVGSVDWGSTVDGPATALGSPTSPLPFVAGSSKAVNFALFRWDWAMKRAHVSQSWRDALPVGARRRLGARVRGG